nr:MAG TPA: hypothetical protein [Caudoviricetes sp.]
MRAFIFSVLFSLDIFLIPFSLIVCVHYSTSSLQCQYHIAVDVVNLI